MLFFLGFLSFLVVQGKADPLFARHWIIQR